MKILFLHGWQSVPGARKPTFLKEHGHEVINPKLPKDDFDESVRIAQAEYDEHHPDVVVGSSRGGAVAMNIESGDTPLVLLCPAWKNWGTAKTVKQRTTILHSKDDDVVPFANSEELAANSCLFTYVKLIETGSDHQLADPEALAKMLEECEAAAVSEYDDLEDDDHFIDLTELAESIKANSELVTYCEVLPPHKDAINIWFAASPNVILVQWYPVGKLSFVLRGQWDELGRVDLSQPDAAKEFRQILEDWIDLPEGWEFPALGRPINRDDE